MPSPPNLLTPIAISLMFAAGSRAGDWPQFRGPGGLGVAGAGEDFPTSFGPGSNQVWRCDLPPGNSSPCVWRDRIFVTGFTEPHLETLGVSTTTGEILWRQHVTPPHIERGSALGNPASPTSVTDGERVISYFGPFGVVAYDLDGHELWTHPLPEPVTQHGVGTSPVLVGGRVILLRDQDIESELLALDPRTGAIAWRVPRPDFRRGFATPLTYREHDEDRVLVPGTLRAVSYAVRDGSERWSVDGLPNEVCASPAAAGSRLFVSGWTPGAGVPRMPTFDQLLEQGDADKDGRLTQAEAPNGPAKHHFPYIDADKDGFITRAEYESMASIFGRSRKALLAIEPATNTAAGPPTVSWQHTRGLPYVPSPLAYEGRLYLVKNGGIASCLDCATGKPLWSEERLDVIGDFYASPIAAGGKILMASQPGTLIVLRSGDTLSVLARNVLSEPVLATPAVAGGRLYVRSQNHLWAFAQPK